MTKLNHRDDIAFPREATPLSTASLAEAPVTEAPVTEAPLTVARLTEASVIEAAVTAASVIEASVIEAPVTAAPVEELAVTSGVSVWNLANALTVLRVVLVPFFALALWHRGGHSDSWRVLAWGFFALASVTDRLDGEVARRRGLVTEFGKLADPIADKALIGTALIGLSLQNRVPWWVTVVILARELGITLLRFWVIRQGVIPASRGGKLKTLVQSVGIGLVVLPLPGAWQDAADAVMAVAVVLTVVTGLDYLLSVGPLRRRN